MPFYFRKECPLNSGYLSCRIDSTAITRYNLYFRTFSEPGRQRTLITAGKQDEGTVSIKIDY